MIISSKNIPIYKVAELDKATGKEVDKEIQKNRTHMIKLKTP